MEIHSRYDAAPVFLVRTCITFLSSYSRKQILSSKPIALLRSTILISVATRHFLALLIVPRLVFLRVQDVLAWVSGVLKTPITSTAQFTDGILIRALVEAIKVALLLLSSSAQDEDLVSLLPKSSNHL